MIQAISFDLWGTLIKASPEFRNKKIELVKPFLTEHKTDTEINSVYTMVKKSYVENSEKFGISYDNLELFKVIVKKLKLNTSAQNLAWYYCDLFLKNPPILLPNVDEMLKLLSKDYKLYLSSNTTLVKGYDLSLVLTEMNINTHFKQMFYSNKIGYSKPNPLFYKEVHSYIPYLKEEILHVGDNVVTDFNGAKNYGFDALLINNSVTEIFDYLKLLKND